MDFRKESCKLPRELLPVPLVTRQHSYTTISRLIMAAQDKPMTPDDPSPEGAGQLKDILGRLEDIDRESRDLLKKLFSMLHKDARLERYIRRRLNDPKVSRMWELVEQVLDSQKHQEQKQQQEEEDDDEEEEEEEEEEAGGHQLDHLEQMLTLDNVLVQYKTGGSNYSSSSSSSTTNKGLKQSSDDQDMMNIGLDDYNHYDDYVTKLERFKIKTLEIAPDEGYPPPPPPPDQTKA